MKSWICILEQKWGCIYILLFRCWNVRFSFVPYFSWIKSKVKASGDKCIVNRNSLCSGSLTRGDMLRGAVSTFLLSHVVSSLNPRFRPLKIYFDTSNKNSFHTNNSHTEIKRGKIQSFRNSLFIKERAFWAFRWKKLLKEDEYKNQRYFSTQAINWCEKIFQHLPCG